MNTVSTGQVYYALDKQNTPSLRVKPGEVFCVETMDCWEDKLSKPEDRPEEKGVGFGNPASGPVFVEGARPGDILRVDIEKIEVRNRAVMCVRKGMGALGDCVEETETTILRIERNEIMFRKGLSLPVETMIGVIGTAPAGEGIPTSTPGEHGGNLDDNEIRPGSSCYFPVNVEGALLHMGDLHALMGDGEVCGCGAEVSGKVTLKAEIVHGEIPTPCVEGFRHLSFLASAKTLDECEHAVLGKAHRFLTRGLLLPANEAARIMSLLGDLGVCQVVDPLKTMRFRFERGILVALGMGRHISDGGK